MARPLKTGVEYFPLDVVLEDEVELIESEHSITAFAVLLKLYQKIYAKNYWIIWDKKEVIVFSKRVNVDINLINAIIKSCFEWGLFDEKLYKKYGILTSNGIQKRFFEIVKRRKEIPVIKEYLLTEIDDNVDINWINVSKSTQSKVKKTKPNKIKPLIYTPKFETLWNDYLNTDGSKSQTFKNYKSAQKKHDMSEDEVCTACMNSQQKQRDAGITFFFQLSNVLGQKYGADLPLLFKYISPNTQNTETDDQQKTKEAEESEAFKKMSSKEKVNFLIAGNIYGMVSQIKGLVSEEKFKELLDKFLKFVDQSDDLKTCNSNVSQIIYNFYETELIC